jgi:hypothetical protein
LRITHERIGEQGVGGGNGERDRDEEDDAIMVTKAMVGWLEVLFADFVIHYERKY